MELNVGARRTRVPVPSSGCSTGCTVTATIDTLTPAGSTSSSSYVLPDARALLQAYTSGSGVSGGTDSLYVTIDNKRPLLAVEPAPHDQWDTGTRYPYSANDSLDISVTATPNPRSSSPVVAVDWAASPAVPFARSTSSSGVWAVSVPTTHLAEGGRTGYAVATNDRGVVSVPAAVGYMVIHTVSR